MGKAGACVAPSRKRREISRSKPRCSSRRDIDMSEPIRAVRGMNDILPDEAERWETLEELLRDWLRSYGYRNVRTPILEHTALFRRAIGEATDIVEKEMYSFTDELNKESLTLRPEATASVARAAAEHSLLYGGAQRLYYIGPMYRHERPQKDRYPQFHQVAAEALRFPGPDIDAELLLMCARLWDDLNLSGIRLQLNCLGSAAERAAYRRSLVVYLQSVEEDLDEDSKRRLKTNPLRVLDSKNLAMQPLIARAPRLLDALGEESLKHFEGVQTILKDAGRQYEINPRLVRGRAIRRPVGAGRRQAGSGLRLGDGDRAPARTRLRFRRASLPGSVPREPGRTGGPLRVSRGGGPARGRFQRDPALRRGQLQVADEKSRRKRRTGRGHRGR